MKFASETGLKLGQYFSIQKTEIPTYREFGKHG